MFIYLKDMHVDNYIYSTYNTHHTHKVMNINYYTRACLNHTLASHRCNKHRGQIKSYRRRIYLAYRFRNEFHSGMISPDAPGPWLVSRLSDTYDELKSQTYKQK